MKLFIIIFSLLLVFGAYLYGENKYEKGYADGSCHSSGKIYGIKSATCKVTLTKTGTTYDVEVRFYPQ